MSKVVKAWVNALPPAERVNIVRAAYECIETFGPVSPIGRAIRQAVLADDIVLRGDDQPIGADQLLIQFDKLIGAMSVMPPTTVALLHRTAMTLELHAPGCGPGAGAWHEDDMRECWAALRRAIDDRRAGLDPAPDAGARQRADDPRGLGGAAADAI